MKKLIFLSAPLEMLFLNEVSTSENGVHEIQLKPPKHTFKKIIYLFLFVLGLHCCAPFSLVVASDDCSVVAVHRFLIVAASPVAVHRLWGVWASVVGAPGL